MCMFKDLQAQYGAGVAKQLRDSNEDLHKSETDAGTHTGVEEDWCQLKQSITTKLRT